MEGGDERASEPSAKSARFMGVALYDFFLPGVFGGAFFRTSSAYS